MPAFGPVKRKDLIRYFKQLGFEGPFSGKRHQIMIKGQVRVPIPNPHKGDISKALLAVILREANISRQEWEKL